MLKNTKMTCKNKEEVYHDMVTYKHKFEQSQHDLAVKNRCYQTVMKQRDEAEVKLVELEHDLNELKSLVVKCFVNAPMKYDDVIVRSHNYHKVCDFLNKD